MTEQASKHISGWFVRLEGALFSPAVQQWVVAIADQAEAEAAALSASGALPNAKATSTQATPEALEALRLGDVKQLS